MVSIIFSILLISNQVQAETLTFNQCLDELSKNAEIQSAEELVASKQYNIGSTRSAYLPKIAGNVSYQRGNLRSSTISNSEVTTAMSLSATQNVFSGFSTEASIDLAVAEMESASANLKIIKAKMRADLKTAFANLVYARETEKINKEFLRRREENLRMVELRFQNGRENKGSLLLSKAYLDQARLDYLKAKNNTITGQSDLKRILAWPDERKLEIIGEVPLLDDIQRDIEYKSIIRDVPGILQAEAQLKGAKAQLKNSKASFLPSLNLSGSVGRYDDRWVPEKENWSVGLDLSIPLFDGGKDYYAIKSAIAVENLNHKKIENLGKEILSLLKKSHLAVIEAKDEYKVTEAFLLAAQTRSEIARSKYNNGLMSFDEWDIIENDLILKAKNNLLAKKALTIAEAAWEQAQGIGAVR